MAKEDDRKGDDDRKRDTDTDADRDRDRDPDPDRDLDLDRDGEAEVDAAVEKMKGDQDEEKKKRKKSGLKYPYHVGLILCMEACERYSYYGMKGEQEKKLSLLLLLLTPLPFLSRHPLRLHQVHPDGGRGVREGRRRGQGHRHCQRLQHHGEQQTFFVTTRSRFFKK